MADSSCDLKVKTNCCSPCRAKARKKQNNINGVTSVVYDSVERTTTVSGDVDPEKLANKYASWSKTPAVLSFKESPTPETKQSGENAQSQSINRCLDSIRQTETYRVSCDYADSSDSDEDNEEDSGTALHKNDNVLTWQHPSIKNKKKESGHKGFLDFPGKKDGVKPPFYCPTTMYSRYQPYSTTAPMHLPLSAVAHPYGGGFWQPRPLREPNPMVRYTSYAANYPGCFF